MEPFLSDDVVSTTRCCRERVVLMDRVLLACPIPRFCESLNFFVHPCVSPDRYKKAKGAMAPAVRSEDHYTGGSQLSRAYEAHVTVQHRVTMEAEGEKRVLDAIRELRDEYGEMPQTVFPLGTVPKPTSLASSAASAGKSPFDFGTIELLL